MTIVAKASAYPKSVQPGLPKLQSCPNGWTRGPLSEHLVEQARPVTMADDETYNLVTVKRSRGGVVLRERLKGAEIAVKSQFRLQAGDFLISKRQIVHGACGIVPRELDGAIVSNEYSVLRPRPELDLSFLNYLANSIHFQQTCFHSSIGVHVEKMIFKLEDWLKWDFDLPPLVEQRRIAEILSTWDDAVTTVEELAANTLFQKSALLQQLVTGKKRLPHFSEPWQRRRFAELALPESRRVNPKSLAPDARGVELEHIEAGTGQLLGTCQAAVQDSQKTPFAPDSVLFGKLRPYLRKFLRPSFAGVCSTEIWVLLARRDACLPAYLYLLVQSAGFQEAASVSAGSKMPRAEWAIVKDASFPVPPEEEQAAIADAVIGVDRQVELLMAQAAALREERAALMQQLLAGKRRVALAESEAA